MKRLLLLLALVALGSTQANAQQAISVANEAGTGTTVGKLAKLTGAPSTAILTGTGDLDGIVGIVVAQDATATTGNAKIAVLGPANCTFDASGVTAGHYVINSTLTAGDCADGGASRPTANQVIGRALATVASGTAAVELERNFTNAGGVATSITPGTTTVVGATAPCLIDNSGTTVMGCAAVGSNVLTALAVNVGTAGAFTKNNGDALSGTFSGTPTYSGNLTFSGVPKFTGLSAGTIASGKNLGLDSSNNLVVATVSGGSGCTTAGTIHNLVTDDGAGGCTSDGSANATAGALSLGASGTVGTVALGNATSGTVTLGTVTGALGSVTASLPANTGTIAELNLAQTWTAAQTFGAVLGAENDQAGTTYTVAATDCGKTIRATNGSAITITIPASIAPAAGTTCVFAVIQGGAGQVSLNGSAVSAATLVSAHSYTKTFNAVGATVAIELTTISATATATLTGDGA